MFGLDISDRTLRLVSLAKRGKRLFIKTASEIAVPSGILKEGEVLQEEKLVSLIQKLIQSSSPHKIATHEVIACLPERKSFIKVIQVSQADPESVKSELANHIPFALDEMYLDWQVANKQAGSETIYIQAGTVPKNIVNRYQDVLKKADLIPMALEIESVAIARALLPLAEIKESEAKLIIDLGRERTSFIIYDNGLIPFTSGVKSISGKLMTDLISKKLSLSLKEAEKAKRLAGFDQKVGKGVVAKILQPPLKDLTQKVKEITEFYLAHYPQGNPIKAIILAGGGANLKGIDKILKQSLGIRATKGDALTNLEKKTIPLITGQIQTSFATAIGLALRGIYL